MANSTQKPHVATAKSMRVSLFSRSTSMDVTLWTSVCCSTSKILLSDHCLDLVTSRHFQFTLDIPHVPESTSQYFLPHPGQSVLRFLSCTTSTTWALVCSASLPQFQLAGGEEKEPRFASKPSNSTCFRWRSCRTSLNTCL